MSDDVSVDLVLEEGFRFRVDFDDPALPTLLTDEPPPVGGGSGPDPARLLAVAVANCLSASLLFALRKHGNEPGSLRAHATARLRRNAGNRRRVAGIAVEIRLGAVAGQLHRLDRVLATFEEFCVVTQSVRAAFPVEIRIFDGAGSELGMPRPVHAPRELAGTVELVPGRPQGAAET